MKIIANQEAVDAIYAEVFGDVKESPDRKENVAANSSENGSRSLTRGDKLLLTVAKKDKKFKQLFYTRALTISYKDEETGEAKDKRYASESEADAALFCKMVYWSNRDPVRALRIVLTSKRLRGKWESGRGGISWVEQEIAKAVERSDDGFQDADVIDFLEMGSRGLMVSPDLVAREILREHYFKTPSDTKQIHFFDEYVWEGDGERRRIGIYNEHGDVFIDSETRKLLKHRFSTTNVREITAIVRAETYCDRDVFDSTPLNLIPLKNGVYDIDKNVLSDYSPDVPFFYTHPGCYNPALLSKMTEARKCVENVLPGEADKKTITDAMVFQEMGGAGFYRMFLYRKALMLFGPKRSGKSILLAILRNAVGKDARARKTLQDLTESRFAEAALYHKTLNTAADIGSLGITNVGKFNELAGGVDTQNCEHKGVDGFEFESYATHAFSTNDLPGLSPKVQKAEKEAFYDRWILIETNRSFVKNPDPDIPNEIKDEGKRLGELLKQQENLDWATTWFIDGLRRALENNGFSEGDSGFNVKERWIAKTDSLAAFVGSDAVEHTPGYHTRADDFTKKYQKFCVETEMVEASEVMIGRRLPHLLPGTEKYESNGKWWRNLTLKGENPIKDDEVHSDDKHLNEPIGENETRISDYGSE